VVHEGKTAESGKKQKGRGTTGEVKMTYGVRTDNGESGRQGSNRNEKRKSRNDNNRSWCHTTTLAGFHVNHRSGAWEKHKAHSGKCTNHDILDDWQKDVSKGVKIGKRKEQY